ncbi:uncharacterized protein LOC109526794 isoform X1 [Hippocampus comes]|uniref:uncharacterized protein LOC109526794 isoform X1 n=2 Tax=Hippocampus comes TaxID=109280 RepID=UPI00094ECFF1|nr:PREDICTED: uncharacterized protein LOC109526794 isoform X1 [Hippocampus comes]
MTMQATFFPFLLIAAHVSLPLDCKLRSKDAEELPLQQSLSSGTHWDMSARRAHYYVLQSAGSVRKRLLGHFLVVHPTKTQRSNYVSIYDLRRKHFVCLDSEGELYSFRQNNWSDCVFSRIGFISAKQSGVIYSPKTSQLVLSHPGSSGLSSVSPKRFLARLVTRQRRSEEVNPSDPLRSESHPSHSVKEHKDSDHGQPEPDQTGAVSKETITSSDDDPLKVLHPNGPVSPVKTNIADRAEQD